MAVKTKIQVRRDTAANWTSVGPTLAAGEFGLDTTNMLIKIGDGSTAWATLPTINKIADMKDANLAGISDQQVIKWDNATSKYVAHTLAAGHTQNSDTGTTGNTFTIDSDSSTGKIILDVALNAGEDHTMTLTNAAMADDVTITFPATTGTVALASQLHTQNTDTGTTADTFAVNSDGTGVKLKDNSGVLEIRNLADNAYADLKVKDLTVTGTTTTINSETLTIDDNVIVLNNNAATGTDGGIEVERGSTGANASILWDESTDVWKMGVVGSETAVSLSGHTHSYIPLSVAAEQGDVFYASGAGTVAALTHGIAGQVLQSGGNAANPSWLTLGTMAAAASGDYIANSLLTEQGDIIYASAVGTPAALAHGTAGHVLKSGGHAGNPSWGTLSATDVGLGNVTNDAQMTKATFTEQGDILYASGVGTPAALAHGTQYQMLMSGGHGANPSWADVDGGSA
jgi:hypothetical protein